MASTASRVTGLAFLGLVIFGDCLVDGSWQSLAQGTVEFGNRFAPEIIAPVSDAAGNKLEGPGYQAQLYAGLTPESLTPVGEPVSFRTGAAAGYWPSSTVVLAGFPPGETVRAQVRVWEAAAGATYEQASAAFGGVGVSKLLTIKLGGDGAPPSPPALLIGLEPFNLRRICYVNDSSISNDEWASAPGHEANDGLSPATPKASVQAILAAYDLEPGDVVRIDTGTYPLASDIVVSAEDSGAAFVCSPYGVTFNRADAGTGVGWRLVGSATLTTAASTKYAGVPQRWMRMTGAKTGFHLDASGGGAMRLSRCEALNNSQEGILVTGNYGSVDAAVENCLVRGGVYGIYTVNAEGVVVRNCTVYGATADALHFYHYNGRGNHTLRNNIVHVSGAGRRGIYYRAAPSSGSSDHNLIYAADGAQAGRGSEVAFGSEASIQDAVTMEDLRRLTGKEGNSLSLDPLFVDVASGDFHLQSTAGSYHEGAFAADAVTSPAIDAGHPADSTAAEPTPYGARINLGAYGGTEQASKSTTGPPRIIVQPESQAVYVGESAMFAVVADGAPPLSYQWRRDNVSVPGLTSATFAVLADDSTSDQADYQAVVYNAAGSTVSSVARLRIFERKPGNLDLSFNISGGLTGESSLAWVNSVAVQVDGRILIGGVFTNVNRTTRHGVARLNPDGTVDPTFDPGSGVTSTWLRGEVEVVRLQADRKILIGGTFTHVGGVPRSGIARLNPEGSVDLQFDPGEGVMRTVPGTINTLEVQPDGKIVIGGFFDSVSSVSRRNIARLSPDGTVDTSFNPGSGTDEAVLAIALSSDGKILIGGAFGRVNEVDRGRIARLNANGGLDLTFNVGSGANSTVRSLILQPNGQILAGGYFETFAGTARDGIARLNWDGSLDATFAPSAGFGLVYAMELQADDRILIGSAVWPPVKRLLPDGRLDETFALSGELAGTLEDLALQQDGLLLVAGEISSLNRVPRSGVLRLLNGAVLPGSGMDPAEWEWAIVDGLPESENGISPSVGLNAQSEVTVAVYSGGVRFLRLTPTGWKSENVATPNGGSPSLAYDSAGVPHVISMVNSSLYYASRDPDSGTWTTERAADYGLFNSLAFDALDQPHASLVGWSGDNTLYYATKRGGQWTTDTVDDGAIFYYNSTGIALDSRGRPHLVYSLYEYPNDEVRHAFKDADGWHIETVTSGQPAADPAPFGSLLGSGPAIAIDSQDRVHVSFYDDRQTNLVYASNRTGPWLLETADPKARSEHSREADVWHVRTAIALLPDDTPLIAYYDTLQRELRLAYRRAAEWRTRIVDSEGSVGKTPSMQVGKNGLPVIAYHDSARQIFKVACALTETPLTNSPPMTVSLTSPSPSSTFSAPATIELAATASGGSSPVQKVEFFAGTTKVGEATSSPFRFTWSEVPPGTYGLTARATAQDSTVAISPLVEITVAPTAPEVQFRFGHASYQVLENAGSLRIPVLKTGAGAASVSFEVTDGTAEPGRDYLVPPGRLAFGEAEMIQEIQITLLDDSVLDGPKHLTLTLRSPSGAALELPSIVVIQIADNELPLTPILFAQVTPPEARVGTGRIQVFLEPGQVGNGGWRLPWELLWHASSQTIGNLDVGSYPVQFRPVAGYREPATQTVPVLNQPGATVRTARYEPDAGRPAGSLTVRIQPPEALLAVPVSPGWRLRGDAGFLPGGARLENLPAGTNNILEFRVISGWIAPPARNLTILARLENTVTATYEPAPPLPAGARQPAPIPTYSEIEDGLNETLRRPLSLMGQLQSAAGYGSGMAVRRKVVLTAAHVLWDESTTNFVPEIEWRHERHAGDYEPKPLRARGWYVFDEYAKQRRQEREQGLPPGVSTPASQQWDVAAIYFDQAVARNGESGYLLSDAPDNEWLLGNYDSFLGGYPLTGQADGRLHAVETRRYRYVHESGHLYSTLGFLSYPGNSGGPLCVLADPAGGRTFYPAAVYLGFFEDRSVVRAIDSAVAQLIARAASSAELGTNFTGGGVINFNASGGERFALQQLTVRLQPAEAVEAGAAWRIAGTDSAFTNALDSATVLVSGVEYRAEFNDVPGWVKPAAVAITLPEGQDAELTVTYERDRPVLTASLDGIYVSGPAGRVAEIEFAASLSQDTVWSVLQTVSLGSTPLRLVGPPWPGVAAGFYRARWRE